MYNMRLIDADKFAERINASPAFPNMGQDGYFLREIVLDFLDKQPTVDIKTEVAKEIFAEIENHIRPFESAEDMHGRQAFENGDTTAMQIHQYAENLLGHFSDYIAELKNKYIGGVGE